MQINSWLRLAIGLILAIATTTPIKADILDRPDFFKQGRDLLEDEIQRLNEETPISPSILRLNEKDLAWSLFLRKDIGFLISMPPGIITQEIEKVEAPNGEIDFNIIASHPSSSRYVVAYSEEVAPERFANTNEILARAQSSIIENQAGLVQVADEEIAYENYPGKEFKLTSREETIVFRLFVVERRLYVLAVSQQTDFFSPDLIEAFLNSFELF